MLIPGFIQRMVIGKVVSLVLGRLNVFQNQIDWNLVQKDLDDKVRAIVPFSLFDDLACELANSALSTIRQALGSSDKIGEILNLLANQEYSEAAQLLTSSVVEYMNSDQSAQSMAQLNIKSEFEGFNA